MADRAPGRYKPVGYDCGMEAARDGNWISYFDHTAKVAALRKAASSDYCAGFDAGFAASHENWNAETINRNDQREMDYLDNQRAAALAAYRATKEAKE